MADSHDFSPLLISLSSSLFTAVCRESVACSSVKRQKSQLISLLLSAAVSDHVVAMANCRETALDINPVD
jgi:hypothetical protein